MYYLTGNETTKLAKIFNINIGLETNRKLNNIMGNNDRLVGLGVSMSDL